MKAAVYTEYGPPEVLRLAEVDRPAPRANEALIKIRAASLNAFDWHMLLPDPSMVRFMGGGLLKPKNRILGTDMAGRVEAIGESATQFKPGDEVYGQVVAGAFAEYVAARAGQIAPKPANLAFEQAAAVHLAGFTALQAIRDQGKVQPGQRVLINGASGGVGSLAVQIAKAFGAEVTGVCSAANADLVRSLGADHVIDYTREDFTSGTARYHLLLDNVGNRRLAEYRRVLEPGGMYLASFGQPENEWLGPVGFLARMSLLSPFVGPKLKTFVSQPSAADLQVLREMIEAGSLKPVVDRTYPLDQTGEAFRHLERWHARGKVVITV